MSSTAEERIARRTRWERRTRVPLILFGLLFIVSYSLYVLAPDLPPLARLILLTDLVVVWIVFLVDYVVRLAITPTGHRFAFVRANIIDLMSVVVPVFRAFRVISLLSDIPYFRARTPTAVRVEVISYAVSYAVLFVYFLSLATLNAERDAPDATITSFGNAIWWACVTLATVGYGDTYPVTVEGRIYAVMLMAGGVAIVGTASALVISYLSERMRGLNRHGEGHS